MVRNGAFMAWCSFPLHMDDCYDTPRVRLRFAYVLRIIPPHFWKVNRFCRFLCNFNKKIELVNKKQQNQSWNLNNYNKSFAASRLVLRRTAFYARLGGLRRTAQRGRQILWRQCLCGILWHGRAQQCRPARRSPFVSGSACCCWLAANCNRKTLSRHILPGQGIQFVGRESQIKAPSAFAGTRGKSVSD